MYSSVEYVVLEKIFLKYLTYIRFSMLLAESGSTKTEWYYENQEGSVLSWITDGYNPNVQTPAQIKSQLQRDILPLNGWKPQTIVFYGSGFSVPEYCDFLESLFLENWKNANVQVHHD